MKNFMVMTGLVFALTGCAINKATPVDSALAVPTFTKGTVFYVVQPEDGTYGGTPYPGSGKNIVDMTAAALECAGMKASKGNVIKKSPKAIAAAAGNGATVLVTPTILHWEDRNTAWSGRRDRIEVKFEFSSVTDGKLIYGTTLYAASGKITLVNHHPDALLVKPINGMIASMVASQ